MHTESDGLKQKIFSAFANKLLFSCHLMLIMKSVPINNLLMLLILFNYITKKVHTYNGVKVSRQVQWYLCQKKICFYIDTQFCSSCHKVYQAVQSLKTQY